MTACLLIRGVCKQEGWVKTVCPLMRDVCPQEGWGITVSSYDMSAHRRGGSVDGLDLPL